MPFAELDFSSFEGDVIKGTVEIPSGFNIKNVSVAIDIRMLGIWLRSEITSLSSYGCSVCSNCSDRSTLEGILKHSSVDVSVWPGQNKAEFSNEAGSFLRTWY